MLLKVALLLSMLIQLGAAIIAVSLIRRTRYNVSWILISSGFVLMAARRLFEFSTLFWETQLVSKEDVNSWIGVFISLLLFFGLIFIRQIFNWQDRVEQIRKEGEMQTLSAVIQAEEKARQVFARDLHDGLGPLLSSIKMTVSAVDLEKLDQTNKKIIERSCTATDEVIATLKEISNNLSPHLLKNYGLTKALETFAGRLFENSFIRFEMESDIGEKRYYYDLEISLYRVISELMNNSLKHAKPQCVELKMSEERNLLRVEYRDDGCGFDQKKQTEKGTSGMGLENIRSRIKSLNGWLYIHTKPEDGVVVTIHIPLR
jgi:signal transduction histidine kinase